MTNMIMLSDEPDEPIDTIGWYDSDGDSVCKLTNNPRCGEFVLTNRVQDEMTFSSYDLDKLKQAIEKAESLGWFK